MCRNGLHHQKRFVNLIKKKEMLIINIRSSRQQHQQMAKQMENLMASVNRHQTIVLPQQVLVINVVDATKQFTQWRK